MPRSGAVTLDAALANIPSRRIVAAAEPRRGVSVLILLNRLLSFRASCLPMMLVSAFCASQCAAGPVEISATGCSADKQYVILDNYNLSLSLTMNRNAVCQIRFLVPYHYVNFVITNKARDGFVGLGQDRPYGQMMTSYGERPRKLLSLIYHPRSNFAGNDSFAVNLGALGPPQKTNADQERFGTVGSVTTALSFDVTVQ
jgi:hypothetical protein